MVLSEMTKGGWTWCDFCCRTSLQVILFYFFPNRQEIVDARMVAVFRPSEFESCMPALRYLRYVFSAFVFPENQTAHGVSSMLYKLNYRSFMKMHKYKICMGNSMQISTLR